MHFSKSFFWVCSSVLAISFVGAMQGPPATVEVENEKSGHSFSLPEHAQAVEHNPNMFFLGTSVDPSTLLTVEGYAILHYKENKAKPDNPGGGNGKGGKDGGSTCYGYIAKNAKWKGAPEPRVVNGANDEGLVAEDIFDIVDGAVDKREDAADGTVADGNSLDIFGGGTLTTDTLDPGGPLNNKNEVVFGSIADNGVIAVTIVWGIFGGAPRNRVLVERDQIYDQDSFDRSFGGSATTMDVDNIVTHEMGHSFGMGDLYDTACSAETMYGFASEGDTQSRTLEAGDIAGISKLY